MNLLRCICSVISLFSLAGCDTFKPSKVWVETVEFGVAPDVNNNSPVKVTLAILYDDNLWGKISSMPAADFYKQEDQLQSDAGDNGQFFDWEIVPGQNEKEKEIEMSKAAGVGAVVFARYSTPGAHRVALSGQYKIRIALDKKDFKVVTIKP